MSASTDSTVNLAQLDAEVAALAGLEDPPGLSMTDDGTTRTVSSKHPAVTDAILTAALAAHDPDPPPPTEGAVLQQQINELTDLILFGF